MIAMQYSFTFPADYEMERIRHRIQEKGPTFNGLTGLVQKSFLYNEKGVGWASDHVSNQYAPFYIWRNAEAMRDFLLSERFEALVQAFGRPQVRSWQVLEFAAADLPDFPAFALRETVAISPSTTLSRVKVSERALHQHTLEQDSLHSRVVALDPDRWEIIRFSIWNAPTATPKPSDTQTYSSYRVLYMAT